MKILLFALLTLSTTAVSAQRLMKPTKDKKTGVTVTRTERSKISATKKSIFIGMEALPLRCIVSKTDTSSDIFLQLSGDTPGYRFEILKGDSIKVALADGSTLWLLCNVDSKAAPQRHPDGHLFSVWWNLFRLDPQALDILQKNEIISIGASSHDKKYHMLHEIDARKKDFIKKAIVLVKSA